MIAKIVALSSEAGSTSEPMEFWLENQPADITAIYTAGVDLLSGISPDSFYVFQIAAAKDLGGPGELAWSLGESSEQGNIRLVQILRDWEA